MFDALAMPTPDLMVVLTASVLAGLAIALPVYVLAASAHEQAGAAAAVLGEHQRRLRRQRSRTGVTAGLLPVFAGLGRAMRLDSVRDSLATRYARAGWPGGLDNDEVLGLGVLLGVPMAVLLMAIIAFFNPLATPLGLVGVLAGPGLLSSSLNRRGEKREFAINRTMPFVLDLLVLTMRAGASLQQAIERVALDYASHPIGVEFRAVLTDLETGVTTREAFDDLARRVAIDAIRTFVDEANQAEELGRPLADIFERQADQSRTRRVQLALETAGRAKVMVLVPGMLVFIAGLVLLFSPFVLRYFYGGYGIG